MAKSLNSAGSGVVSCEVCLKEVQHTRTVVEEVNDYVLYFCGLECYERWRDDNPPEADS